MGDMESQGLENDRLDASGFDPLPWLSHQISVPDKESWAPQCRPMAIEGWSLDWNRFQSSQKP